MELFVEIEGNEHDVGLVECMFRIVRYVISVAENELLELLLSDEYYLFVFGVLECKSILYTSIDDSEI